MTMVKRKLFFLIKPEGIILTLSDCLKPHEMGRWDSYNGLIQLDIMF